MQKCIKKIGIALFALLFHVGATASFLTLQTTRDSTFPTFPRIILHPFGLNSIHLFDTLDQAQEADGLILPDKPPLTVLLPAYNEVDRIGETLRSYHSYLSNWSAWKNSSQILVVDDGSNDGTAAFVHDWKHNDDAVIVSCISLPQNQGKGAAVSFGISYLVDTFGENVPCLVLIADADGSGGISCLNNMTLALERLICCYRQQYESDCSFWNTPALVNGNRGYQGSSVSRSILRWGFRTTAWILCGDLRVEDTQCGFRLATLTGAKQLYQDLNLKGWSHDVEVFYRARQREVPVAEEVVPWQDKAGSKLVDSSLGATQASAIMFLQVLQMRFEYVLGRWK